MITVAASLRWRDVDPHGRHFDPSRAKEIARRLVTEAAAAAPVDRDRLEAAIDRALLAEYGAWAAGWNWAASEPGGGGPVTGWCCPRDSLLRKGEEGPEPQTTIDRVVAALENWQAFLSQMDAAFASIHEATREEPLARAAEHAAARLLPLIIGRTGAEDAWYATFGKVLLWYLEARGVAPDRIAGVVHETISGRFESWTAPEPPLAQATCEALGEAVAAAAGDGTGAVSHAGLAEWLAIRDKAFANPPGQRERARVYADGHRRYIEGPERARDPERARRMATALESARAAARRGKPLDFGALAAFQQMVLGVPKAAFRARDAFAKGGRERYALDADTQEVFERCLAEAGDPSVPVAVRAAKVYLDVCFFHPFDDGNARAARIALDYVVTSERLTLHAIEPVIILSRAADDADGAWCLARVLEMLLGVP